MVGQSRNLEVESSCGKLRCMCLSNSCVLFLPSLAEEDGMGWVKFSLIIETCFASYSPLSLSSTAAISAPCCISPGLYVPWLCGS